MRRPESGAHRSSLVAHWILTISAATMAVVLLHREFFSVSRSGGSAAASRSLSGAQLDEIRQIGHGTPGAKAPVTLAVFSDFECPFCRQFHDTWKKTRATWGDSVALIFVHYPLINHKYAEPAARASICADEQGSFWAYADEIFSRQGTGPLGNSNCRRE